MTDKDGSSKKSWLKNWFKSHTSPAHTEATVSTTLHINDEIWESINTNSAPEARINRLQQLDSMLQSKTPEKGIIEKLWIETKDLLQCEVSQHVRSTYLKFLLRCIKNQFKHLGMLRPMFYQELKLLDYTSFEDNHNIMLVVDTLSDHGKNLCMLENEIGTLLVKWINILAADGVFLSLLQNVVKFNSSHVDKETTQVLVMQLCRCCNAAYSDEEVKKSLQVLDAIICYNSLPQDCLYSLILTLCRTLNFKDLCDQSWKMMRNLLGTHLGHACIEIMCQMLQDEDVREIGVLRGAVFYIGMGLWGSKCVQSLTHNPQSVLPSFKAALNSGDPVVGYEISLTCQRLVKKSGHELHTLAWDYILSIVSLLLQTVEINQKTDQLLSLQQVTHELLNLIEKLYQTHAFNGSADELFDIVDCCLKSRPYDSILLLIAFRSQSIKPSKGNWIANLVEFIDVYYFSTLSVKIKLKILDIFATLIVENLDVYEKELADIIIVKFQHIVDESSAPVQENTVKFIIQLCLLCKTNRCLALLQLVEPFMRLNATFADVHKTSAAGTIEAVVHGLADIFLLKFDGEQAYLAVEALNLMVCFLQQYYENETLLKQSSLFWYIRKRIFDVLFEIRVNSKLQVCLTSSTELYSNVVCMCPDVNMPADVSKKSKSSSEGEVLMALQDVFRCIIDGLEMENYWSILEMIVLKLSEMFDNKYLITTLRPDEVDHLAEALTGLVTSSSRVPSLSNTPEYFRRTDLQACALTAIAVVTSFHRYMSVFRQRQILRCLESGFNTKCAKQCIAATTLCIIDMKSDALLRVLPSILLRLSQMSATVHLATVVLELLSSLSQLPALYSNFVDDQYMSVFKIALQHADPTKFSLYIVSLAHHVVNMWFIKCRLAFRPDFVRYITLNLQTMARNSSNKDDPLQHNLIESCIDVMARYTFSNAMPVTKRSILHKTFSRMSRSATWLLGNRLITIKTESKCRTRLAAAPDTPDKGSVATGSDRSMVSLEAPGKLQSSDNTTVRSTRQRHKSSGAALLRRSADPSLLSSPLVGAAECQGMYSGPKLQSDNCLHVTDVGSSWAEVYIRRPSGDTSWLLNSHQLSLMSGGAMASGMNLADSSVISFSTSDLRTQNSASPESNSGENIKAEEGDALSRQRSRTVSSSQDYLQGAAARATIKAKSRNSPPKNNVNGLADPTNERGFLLTPEFVFLQLFHTAVVTEGLQRPILLPNSATIERSVNMLDLIPPYDVWRTGVVYVRPGQSNDGRAILENEHGSDRYQNFLCTLGKLVLLADCDITNTHLGGLDTVDGDDGLFTYVWQENVMQMVFHVATLMPNKSSGVGNKQRHIGNDYVTVVYDDNVSQSYCPGSVVKGQFLSVEIIITPLDLGHNSVTVVYHKPELKAILQIEEKRTVSDDRLGLLVKQLSLHANMASAAHHHKTPEKFVSKPLSRLKQIKHIRARAMQELAWKEEEMSSRGSLNKQSEFYPLEDFSDFV